MSLLKGHAKISWHHSVPCPPPWSLLVLTALDCTEFRAADTVAGLRWVADKYLSFFFFFFKPHTVKLSLLPPVFGKLIQVGSGT